MDPHPPPPYSETDIYSNNGSSPHAVLTPATSQADNASVGTGHLLLSTASSADDSVIYTPLHSPTGSEHQEPSFAGDFGDIPTSSASLYFESRPAHLRVSGQPKNHSITATRRTRPDELPYPQEWASKDVTQQDWATFINYLFPDHTASANSEIADRKLKAELIEERMHRLTLGQDEKSRLDMNQVVAQLDPLRQPLLTQGTESTQTFAATIAEWNQWFFEPRGLHIINIELECEPEPDLKPQATPREEPSASPSVWIPYDHEILPNSAKSNGGGRKGIFGSFKSFPGMESNSQGFRLGPILANNEGFRIGRNGLVADSSGFRVGNMLVADSNGFRLGGTRGFVADRDGVSMGGRAFGRRESYEDHHTRGRERRKHHGRGHGHHGHGHGPGRRGRGRSSSTSSSSSSSSDSADSISSVGSLPGYDDLKDQQLPIARQSLIDWLNHPEQPITKDTVQNIKREIRDAKTNGSDQPEQVSIALRKEIKDLMKVFKEHKRAQKQQRKIAKRARRAARKALRKERRDARKDVRKSRKEERKCKGKEREKEHAPHWAMNDQFPPVSPGMKVKMPSFPGGVSPSTRGFPSSTRGFPFGRAASAPFIENPLSRGPQFPPGMMAMHGGWPFAQGLPHALGSISVPQLDCFPSPVSHSAEQIHEQAIQMEKAADRKEAEAVELRTAATVHGLSEKEMLKMKSEATSLEEDAEKYKREADRLRAEALHLDGELARELEDNHEGSGQVSGVIQH